MCLLLISMLTSWRRVSPLSSSTIFGPVYACIQQTHKLREDVNVYYLYTFLYNLAPRLPTESCLNWFGIDIACTSRLVPYIRLTRGCPVRVAFYPNHPCSLLRPHVCLGHQPSHILRATPYAGFAQRRRRFCHGSICSWGQWWRWWCVFCSSSSVNFFSLRNSRQKTMHHFGPWEGL
jgi:hypothetical protein